MCFVITRGLSEIYDILTHITFLNIEAHKLYHQACNKIDGTAQEWRELEKIVLEQKTLEGGELDQAIWNLSIILGRTYKETHDTYLNLRKNQEEWGGNNGLFQIVYTIGKRVIDEQVEGHDELTVYFTPSLLEMIGQHKYTTIWAQSLKERLYELGFQDRPIHVVSANMHSLRNILYGPGTLKNCGLTVPEDLYEMVRLIRDREEEVMSYGKTHGLIHHGDRSGANVDVHIIDTLRIDATTLHPSVHLDFNCIKEHKPVLVVMDYAFGTQAFEVLDELLCPCWIEDKMISFRVDSVSIMGKAGILSGKKGDIMLATAHVMEGTPHNYIVKNDLSVSDFEGGIDVYSGPMVTVLGTSLQNRDVLERFHTSSWKAIGLEMEGGHYQRAINAAIIQGHISSEMKTRYAYYGSDNPLISGQTLASGPMGEEGIVPTYMISKVILQKILSCDDE